MANLPISGLTAGVAVADTDLFADVQSPTVGPMKVTALQIKTYIGNGLTLTGAIINNPVIFNGVSYTFPAANGPVGSVLTNSGVGVLTWQVPAGITSVALDASPVGLTVAGSPITGSSGTFVINGGVLNVANGGTGAATPAAALINLLPPTSPSTASYVLANDGSGNFYWTAGGGGGGGGGGVISVSTTVGGLNVIGGTGNAVLQGTVSISGGGTGQTTALGARNAIMPAQAGQAGKVLGTDGNNMSWVPVSGTGTVTSVSFDPSTTGLTINGTTAISTITTSGTFQLGGTLAVTNGGTGRTSLGTGVQTALGNGINTNGGFLTGGVGGVLPILQGGTGQTTANAALNALLPSQATNSGKVLQTDGTNATWQSVSATAVSSFGGGTTGLTPVGPATGPITLGGTLSVANGGTGVNGSAAPNGSLLIGNGTGYTLATLTGGPGITIDNTVAGAITITATGGGGAITQVTTNMSGLSVTGSTGPIATLTGTLLYGSGGTGLTAAPTDGQLLIGNGSGYTLAQLTAGTNINITNAAGSITIDGPAALVSSISFGSTGLTPSTATSGAVTVAGTLALGFGGTGLSAVGVSGTTLVSNGTTLAYGNPNAATNIVGGTLGQVPYQSGVSSTLFAGPGAAGTYLGGNGVAAPTFKAATLTLGSTVLNLNTTTTALTGMTGITMTGGYVPPGDDDVATKSYVDNVIQPINRIAPADCATTGPITLSGLQTIDGVTLVGGERVLVKDQAVTTDDGVYDVSAGGVFTRATDIDAQAEFVAASVFVTAGTANANTSWIQTLPVSTFPPPQNWSLQSGLYNYLAGPGITLSPANTINNAGVLSWSGGTTGLTPSTATTGAVTMTGTLNIANGGTQATTAQAARNNLLPTQTGQNGKFLQTDGTNVSWATSSGGAVYYINITSTGTVPLKISGAGYTDSVGNSYVLYNSTASNITLTATSFPNFASFTDCTATSIVLGAGKTMMITTTVANSTYAIDASNYLSGGIFVATPNASSTMVNIINGIPAIDNEGNLYAIENTSNAPIVISGLTIDNPSSYPGYTQTNSVTIPAYGEALLLTTATSANYVVLSLSNSVATNLSGGSQNRIVYQTAANATDFLPTGTAGQVLLSSGSGAAPVWGTATSAHYIPISTDQTFAAAILAASIVDTVGAVYVFYNSDTASHTLTAATGIDNYDSWPVNATSTVLTLQTKQTATVVTDTVGTNYSIVAVSSLSSALSIPTMNDSTVSALVTPFTPEYAGLIVNIRNNDTNPITLTATSFAGYEAWSPASGTSSIILDAGKNVLLLCTSAGSYTIMSMSTSNTTFVSTSANYLLATQITHGFTMGDLLTLTNTAATSITVTAAAFDNYVSYPSNATSTVFTVGSNATVTFALSSATANNWQIISYSSNATTAVTSTGVSGTITAAITAGSIVEQVGMLVTIRNTQSGSSIGLTGTLTNFQPWAPAASASGVIIQANECVTLRVVTPGSAYDVINLTNTNIAADVTADFNLSATINSGTVLGGLATFTNTNAVGNVVITADSFENGDTWPVPTRKVPTSGPYNKFYLPADGTVTFALTSTTANNWKIISYEYPAMQAGAVAFAIGNATGSPATLGPSKVIDATTLFPVVTYGTPDTASLINPQNYLDTATGIFQPLVAGYYQINATITQSAANTTPLMGVGLIKNWDATTPDLVAFTVDYVASSGGVNQGSNISAVVYMNGTTDTLRVGLYISAGAWSANGTANAINFSGSLVTQQNIINTTSGIYNVPIDSADDNRTVPAILSSNGIGEVVNDLYVITNIDTVNVTITATSFIGYQAYPSQATATSIVLTPGATLELQNVTIGSGYQIVILNTPINVGSVAFRAAPVANTAIGTSGVYPAPVMKFPTTPTYNPQNYYNPSTGRFQPQTAGYYQVNSYIENGGGYCYLWVYLYKNGTIIGSAAATVASFGQGVSVNEVVYMNGTTDYLELGMWYGATALGTLTAPFASPATSSWSAALINQTLTEVVGINAAAYAYKATTQAIASATLTKVTFGANTDPQNWWNAANNRWIPTIPGFYEVNLAIWFDQPAPGGSYEALLSQNGGTIGNAITVSNPTGSVNNYLSMSVNRVIYMNGTTDFLEGFVYQSVGSSVNLSGSGARCNFNIALIGANQAVPAVVDTTASYNSGSFPGGSTQYGLTQLDNLKVWWQGATPAYLYIGTVAGTTTLQGAYQVVYYGGGAGANSITNTVGSGGLAITTAGASITNSSTMNITTAIFQDTVANRSYRVTAVLQHGYVNSQAFIERLQ